MSVARPLPVARTPRSPLPFNRANGGSLGFSIPAPGARVLGEGERVFMTRL